MTHSVTLYLQPAVLPLITSTDTFHLLRCHYTQKLWHVKSQYNVYKTIVNLARNANIIIKQNKRIDRKTID